MDLEKMEAFVQSDTCMYASIVCLVTIALYFTHRAFVILEMLARG
jgi:hypothetical protein